jgi:predicted XRE-type DNA-binding protein
MASSAFFDIADTPEEAANLTARSLLMIAIEERIKERGWTQTQAAEILHVTQPRVSDLINGKLHKFSLDALVNMLPAVGLVFDGHPVDEPGKTSTPPQKKAPAARSMNKTPTPRKRRARA